ncbi:unnamed protein product [Ilex paraguariensis]|uniref:Uncharacterized protein n=1 Tax=Ilex paraguariensis TaxID=185542 RepID=A0ABC8SN00_9AQUA
MQSAVMILLERALKGGLGNPKINYVEPQVGRVQCSLPRAMCSSEENHETKPPGAEMRIFPDEHSCEDSGSNKISAVESETKCIYTIEGVLPLRTVDHVEVVQGQVMEASEHLVVFFCKLEPGFCVGELLEENVDRGILLQMDTTPDICSNNHMGNFGFLQNNYNSVQDDFSVVSAGDHIYSLFNIE